MGACEKVKSEMVVPNPWVWDFCPLYLRYVIMALGIDYLIKGYVLS
jgi:hypothetical protein